MNSNLRKANGHYQKSQETTGMSNSLKRSHLEKALSLYRSELRLANWENLPSLRKNLGLANYRLADILDPDDNLRLKIHYFCEAIQALSVAWASRPEKQNTVWRGRLEELISDCFEKSHRSLSVNGYVTKFHFLDKLSKAIGSDPVFEMHHIRLHLANGQFLYRCGVKVLDGLSHKCTQRLVEHARHEYELAVQSAQSAENKCKFSMDMSRLLEDISFLKLSCDAIKLREQADQMFDDYVMQPEMLEMVWDILDMYKASEMHSRDIKTEAIALSRQGRLFYNILRLPSKAHEYYRASFDLAVTLHTKNMGNCDWFEECKTVLKEIQKSKVCEEDSKKAQERAPYLDKMKDTLNALEQHSTDAFKLLKHIYGVHPPKVSFKYEDQNLNSSTIKKAVMKAIIQYHPDKQIQYDMEWRVLSEEITKYLNACYESFKGL